MPLRTLGEISTRASSPLPAYAVFGVLEDDAVFGELCADSVGAGEVPGLARLRVFGDKVLNFGVAERCGLGKFLRLCPLDHGANFGRVVVLQHRKNLLKLLEYLEQRWHVALANFSCVSGCVHVTHHVENRAQGSRCVEVIIKASAHFIGGLSGDLAKGGICALFEL